MGMGTKSRRPCIVKFRLTRVISSLQRIVSVSPNRPTIEKVTKKEKKVGYGESEIAIDGAINSLTGVHLANQSCVWFRRISHVRVVGIINALDCNHFLCGCITSLSGKLR